MFVSQGAGDSVTMKTERSYVDGSVMTLKHDIQVRLKRLIVYILRRGTAVAEWLRVCATNRNVAGSIPADVIGFFIDIKILPIALWSWGRLSL